jgi:hypothetical protein
MKNKNNKDDLKKEQKYGEHTILGLGCKFLSLRFKVLVLWFRVVELISYNLNILGFWCYNLRLVS